MKTIQRSLMVVLILMLTLAGCAAPPAQTLEIVQEKERSIVVSGSGEVMVTPDKAQFVVGILSQDKKLESAKEANDEIARKVLAVLKQHDIAAEDIKTDFLYIQPKSSDYASAIYAYSVSKSIKVIVRDLNDLESIISDVLDAGANRLYGLSFEVTDVEKYEQEARTKAIQAAKEKAVAMAGDLGQEIGEPIYISESTFISRRSYNGLFEVRANYLDSYFSIGNESGTMSFGQITITAGVSIEFSLK